MSRKTKLNATKEDVKSALVPKLRFPEFRKAEGWDTCKSLDGFATKIANSVRSTLNNFVV